MNKKQLQQILTDHLLWLQGKGGSRADLSDADLEHADLTGADLSRALLLGANLGGTDLSGANLTDANLEHANLTDANLEHANLTDADLYGTILSGANLERANLTGTYLSRALLLGADLSKANLASIKEDVWRVLSSAPDEVQAVRAALVEGRVDGGLYEGECACLVGTIANARGVPYESLDHDEETPAERWFFPIRKGNTPSTSQFSKIALEWIDEWIAKLATPATSDT